MAEWSKALVLKTSVGQPTGGSNPSASASAAPLRAVRSDVIYRLDNSVMAYAWGSTSAIAELQGRRPSGQPEAELWMGAHPKAPSRLSTTPGETSLSEMLAAEPERLLGGACTTQFGPQLPFLFKVLAAAQPLSIQVHPSLEQARAGFAKEEQLGTDRMAPTRTYRDSNHKPELICAVSDFEALCGLRPAMDITRLFEQLAIKKQSPLGNAAAEVAKQPRPQGIRSLFSRLMTDENFQQAALREVVSACSVRGPLTDFPSACRWALELNELYPGDVGVVGSLLLNYVKLNPGQALFLSAGIPHAYLKGLGMELMANSDNVVRGGLTPKHVDVAELLSIVDFERSGLKVIEPQLVNPQTQRYATPASEFELTRVTLSGEPSLFGSGPQIAFVDEGSVRLGDANASLELSKGQSAFIGADSGAITVSGHGSLFCAGLPATS